MSTSSPSPKFSQGSSLVEDKDDYDENENN